ncbi:MAG: hypothetical protein ACLP1D_26245 [Xanthobacteraceae bacterium]
MLPGFRFVFATVVLAVSVLVFGLGAAALLRASHDQFANLPTAQASHEPVPARDQQARQITLALLRVEMMAEQSAAAKPPAPTAPDAATAAPAPPEATPAALRADAVASDAAPIERPAANDSASVQTSPETVLVVQPMPAEPATAEVKPIVASHEKAAALDPVAVAGCIPSLATTAQTAERIAMLVDQAPARADLLPPDLLASAAATTKLADIGKSAVHRVRHARLRHKWRRHRHWVRAQAQLAPFAGRQQAQQTDPFAAFPR